MIEDRFLENQFPFQFACVILLLYGELQHASQCCSRKEKKDGEQICIK